nr:chromatin-remodeling ATPase INO80 [Vanessa tameamea]
MRVLWLCLATVCMVVCTAERGGSLRGALEALQRRQRGRVHVPVESSDYEAFYDFVPPQAYPEPDYSVDPENADDETSPKYIVRLLENERPSEAYEYKIIKKKSAYSRPNSNTRQPSPFRERSQHSDNDRLRDLFMDRDEDVEENSHILENEGDNDIEYAVLLDQLWSKYKNNQGRSKNEDNAEGVVKLYKDKIIKKRFPNNWGPVAFKRKRSPESNMDRSVLTESEYIKNNGDIVPRNSNYNSYEVSDNDDDNDKDDMREEYAIAFQPLNDDSLSDLADEDQYAYETIEKRFPVTKRSSEPYNFNSQKKRFAPDQNKRDTKTFRNSAGTDPKIIRDLSKIFGNAENEFIKSPVKRNTDHVEKLHDSKPPTLVLPHNHTVHDHNLTMYEDNSHEEKEHKIHPPGVFGKEEHYHNTHESEHTHDKDHKHNHDKDQHENDNNQETEKPIKIKKKSIDWSDYFGIDKRLKKSVSFVNNLNEDRLKKQYFDTFNKEVIYPLNSFRKNNYAKRNYVQPNEETNIRMNNDHSLAKDEKRNSGTDNESKLDNIDKKLKNMEGIIVDEALHYSNIGEELDSKEEQEMKEKLLSRLAAAYSLEKMRKALKEFKQSLQMQKASSVVRSSSDHTSDKYKRVVIKKEKVLMPNDIPIASEKNDDFEDEQGAGHYLNGKMEEQLSEGYMGGSGSHHTPVMSTVSSMGACPVLAKIVQRCRGVDLLAGDRGQLFLPLCSLHQICYLCGEAPPTTCDLVFLSEADSSCEGDMSCQRAARSALMALRELHENLVDELDGECEASPCLPATLKLNLGWQRALHR